MSKIINWLIICCWTLVLTSCTNGKDRKYVIGVSQCSNDIWRDKLNSELKMGEYFNDSISVKLASSNDDSKKQIQQINKFIDENVSLLIVSPNQLNTISSALDRAYDKGIPVILFDRKTCSQKYTAFIGCNNFSIGKMMGTFIAQRLHGHGKVVEIRGLEGSSPAIERHRGFLSALQSYPNIQLVASEAGDWKEDSGEKVMRHILQHTQDFDFIFSHNDRMAMGAYKAAKAMAPTRSYRYTGVDALPNKDGGLEKVRNGILEATCLYPTMGNEVIALAMDILKHRPYQRDNYLYTSIITKENVELRLMEAKDAIRQKENLTFLHQRVDEYLTNYQNQKMMIAGLSIILLVFIIAIVLVYRGYLIKIRLNEKLAKQNEEMKKLNNEIMELTHSRLVFFTNISHELRTPLTLIADPVEMLLEDEHIKGKSRDLLKMLQRNANALQQLVDNILDFRKIQNGKMNLKLTRFNMAKALQTWTSDFQLTAERKHIQIHLDTTDKIADVMVIADKEKMARIIFNLLSNALKYTPNGGDIFVALKDNEEGMMRIDVKDTGKGIPKEEIKKIFERFFQAQGATSGTGIGLALVKSFVELHHGTIRVESEVGKGSDFIVVMPRQQTGTDIMVNDDNADNSASSSNKVTNENVIQYIDDGEKNKGMVQKVISEQTDKPTLLIIDDNNDIRQYERMLLQDKYFVLEASDGKEGWNIAKKEVPDLVICDVMMPVMDGLEFTEHLKSNMATSHIPVIMLTAKNLDEHRAEGYEYGADSYITKPFHSKVLLARIENLLKQRKRLKDVFIGSDDDKENMDEVQLVDSDKQFIKLLNSIIQKNISNCDFCVDDIGNEIGLSRVQLYRKTKAMTGTSVVDLIRRARLAKAHHLLEAHSMSISEVAYEVGFSAPSYFTKCFKNEYGILPGEVGKD